jgi:FkbM family methyltransferase
MNGWEDRCQALSVAVANVEGSAKLHVPFGDVPKSASLHSQGFRGYEGSLIDVPVTTIDAICSESERVDLVKIDVEGFEDKVLEGMQQVLADSTPTIIVECNPDGPFAAIETILTRFGYRFFHLRREGPVAADKIIPDKKERDRNFLCTVYDDWGRCK